MTMDVQSATYTKIGRQVTVCCFVRTDNVDTTGASGLIYLGGLPFTSGSHSAGCVGYSANWTNEPSGLSLVGGATIINLTKNDAQGLSAVADLTTGATADQNQIIAQITYFV